MPEPGALGIAAGGPPPDKSIGDKNIEGGVARL